MANPLLNDKALPEAAKRSGTWAPPAQGEPGYGMQAGYGLPTGAAQPTAGYGLPTAPMTDGPVSAWPPAGSGALQTMTVGGTASATGVLMVLLLASATFGWFSVDTSDALRPSFPSLAIVGVLVGFVSVIACYFKPQWAKFLSPVYAIGEGYFLGVISKNYESWQHGIVVQAAGATLAVFAVMLFLYHSRIIKVTNRMRRIVMGATLGIAIFYGISMLINLFGGNVNFLHSTSGLSIGFSFLVAGLAAFNLALDFDFIERGARAGLPKHMEWFAALGLLVTLVWLYLEILRLLSKLRER